MNKPSHTVPPYIAILGWGSLLWDERHEFDKHHSPWELDGPELRIEFSRVSQSRCGALTLVIDPPNGATCRVAHTKSKRRNPEDAICDLRSREGTTRSNIGFYFADGSRHQFVTKDTDTITSIQAWAAAKSIDVVVWTALPSNFDEVCGHPFSVEHALEHVRALDPAAKSGAAEYVWRAPAFVNTPLRVALQSQPWFNQ
jgi:hypothetical protein